MEFFNKPDDGRQHRRQSKDFKEVINIQTDMNIDDLKWDKIFHNWDNYNECNQRKLGKGCIICKMIDNGESVEHLKPKRS